MQRTISQNKRLHALCNALGVDKEAKEDLVYQYTKGRTTSSAQMLMPECEALNNNLQHLLNRSGKQKSKKPNTPANNMRGKILSICHEMNWHINGELDWKRINNFLFKYGYLKKAFNDYTASELPTLITQFEQLLKDYYAKR